MMWSWRETGVQYILLNKGVKGRNTKNQINDDDVDVGGGGG